MSCRSHTRDPHPLAPNTPPQQPKLSVEHIGLTSTLGELVGSEPVRHLGNWAGENILTLNVDANVILSTFGGLACLSNPVASLGRLEIGEDARRDMDLLANLHQRRSVSVGEEVLLTCHPLALGRPRIICGVRESTDLAGTS